MTEQQIINDLRKMENDSSLITKPAFTTDKSTWPDSRIPFVEYHVKYLQTHKLTTPEGYLSNLRLMLRVRK
jgi:hypothetical protein